MENKFNSGKKYNLAKKDLCDLQLDIEADLIASFIQHSSQSDAFMDYLRTMSEHLLK